jgi:uncharacterized protein
MPMPPCPICKKPVKARDENAAFPFCGERCRLLDLGNWLGESYRVPVTPDEDEDGGAPGPRGDDGGGGAN